MSGGPFPIDTFKVEDLGDRSGLTVSLRFEGGVMGKIVTPKIRKVIARDTTRLKDLLEGYLPS